MKIVFIKDKLKKGLRAVLEAVPTNVSKPILKSLVLQPKDGNIEFAATDLEYGVRVSVVPVKAEKVKDITIPARRFFDIVSEADGDIAIDVQAHIAKIKFGNARYEIYCDVENEYPAVASFPVKSGYFSLDAAEAADMLKRVAFAVTPYVDMPAISGVLFSVKKGMLELVATDGKRLARISRKILGKPKDAKVIVPIKAVRKIAGKLEGQSSLDIAIKDSEIIFRTGNVVISTRVIDDRFPDYEEIIPEKMESTIKISRAEFENAVRKVIPLADEETRTITMAISKGNLKFSSKSETGLAEFDMPVEYTGKGVDIGFNYSFLLEALRAMGGEEITFSFSGASDPATMTDVKDYIYVLTAVRIRE